MASYRVYCLDGTGKVASAEWIEADGDKHALSIVNDRWGRHNCELWDGKRLVARIDAKVA